MLRLVLVVGLGYGVMGVVVADLVVTAVLLVVMVRWFAPLIRPVFSAAVLRESLAFGLPRVPHGFAQQVIAVGDKFILTFFVPLSEIGLYAMGVSVGLIQKVFLAAFEYAWAPFYYATVREPGAERVFSAVTTYGVAILALMTAGLSAIAADLLHVVTHGQYTAAAGVVAWTSLGVFFQGVYLMTSIGLNITRRTRVLSGRDGHLGRGEHRPERAAHPAIRHHGRRLRERRRVRRAGRDRLSLFAALLSRPLRNRPAGTRRRGRDRGLCRGPGAAGHGPGARRARARDDGRRRDGRGTVAWRILPPDELRVLERFRRSRGTRAQPADADGRDDRVRRRDRGDRSARRTAVPPPTEGRGQ